ncbi:MAG: sugar kinase, partial [Desulfofustis sp.]|nr:sugar kinase [Desulfofustis sp.]
EFRVWEGGGEYNVARGLSSCFGKRTAVVTALVANEIGRLIGNRIAAGGVDTRLIRWREDDGIGETCRNGLNFVEKGFGLRSALGVSDRGHTAISQVRPGEIDWQQLFDANRTSWFHSGGIMAGLSGHSPDVVIEAVQAAKAAGATVSYDLNFRPSLWRRFGGRKRANEVNRMILPHVDVLFGVDTLDAAPAGLDTDLYIRAVEQTAAAFPNLKAIATTMRRVISANANDWSGLLCIDGAFFEGPRFEHLEIYDRIGSGDGFAAGIIYGLLEKLDGQRIVDYGVLHGALAMTTPGDNSMSSLADLDRYLTGAGSGVIR